MADSARKAADVAPLLQRPLLLGAFDSGVMCAWVGFWRSAAEVLSRETAFRLRR